ncbi:uncharacterized protein BX663DRAFT_515006 [Cokeromyces recurvatus]|uniref:uncharacterized protein n=1 Tax=Cokeromyces recurvatus TaxID=90255 RepID=UPI00221EF62E|nr:uncharacterized protein BX663DRAFT_515006 [Cokeromyces recurvatus]KAI7901122.1 hypothetical protein BX663DRAFT_515006 [Cokeromyces recurvatus]
MSSNKKRKAILPLHIDTTSFTAVQSQNSIYNFWRRLNKRQFPVFILLTILFFSLFLNLIQYNQQSLPRNDLLVLHDSLPPVPLTAYHHAVIIAGHAIYKGPSNIDGITNDDNWVLESYQQGGQVQTYIEHIKKGIDILKEDSNAVLIFSGGETRPTAGPRSESFSYWQIAQILLDDDSDIPIELKSGLSERMLTEEFAKDSHENLLFSICRFAEMTSNYPKQITVVGFEFKRKRFEDIHRHSIRYPIEQFHYIGIDPKDEDPSREEGELVNSLRPFEKDLYGCHGSLKQKKALRNPYRQRHAYGVSCPVLAPLLNYCPSNNELYTGPLPWILH